MATHSFITMKLNKEDFGRVFKSNKDALPNPLEEYNYECKEIKIPSKNYIGVYCHFDGYLEGVGKELITKFNTYDKVLNLICLGDLSCIINRIVSYHNSRNENIGLITSDEPKTRPNNILTVYRFENNEWYVGDTKVKDLLSAKIDSNKSIITDYDLDTIIEENDMYLH
jgi:hypothetical protein